MKYNIIGLKFNNLTVIEQLPSVNRQSVYKCACDCGKITYGAASKIISGKKKSCGCLVSNEKHKDVLAFLLRRLRHTKKRANVDITLDFLWEKYMIQGGKCYYTGLPLEINSKNPYTISIDRLDSSLSYSQDNVVLTCLNVNLFKNVMSVEAFVAMLEQMRNIDKSQIPFYKK